MGRVILCIGNYAKTPYYLERACLNIYSIEELCFYLSENAYLVDKEILNPRLPEWIAEECGLEELGKELFELIRKKCIVSQFVAKILEDVGYLKKAEIEELAKLINNSSSLNLLEKKKTRADYFVKQGKIIRALEEYEQLIEEIAQSDDLLLSRVLHNIGVLYADMFEFGRAAAFFLKSYKLSYYPGSYISYLAAMRLKLTESEYIVFVAENQKNYQMSMEVEQKMEQAMLSYSEYEPRVQLEEIKAYKNSRLVSEYYIKVEEQINIWKENYRSFVEE